jgi:hypothetical protein
MKAKKEKRFEWGSRDFTIVEEEAKRTAKSLEDVLKFNQNHDELGRFSESQGGGTHNNRHAGITDSDRKMFAGKSFSEFQKEELPGYFKAKKNGQPHPLSKYANEKGNLDPDRVEEAWYKTNLDESSKGAHKINTGEADRIIGENIPDSVLDGWFRQADSSYKPKIEEATIKNKDLRNAALNVAHENYNDYRRAQGNPPVDFDEWLTTPIKVYRGERGQGHVEDDVFTAYSYDRKVAESFGPDVSEREIRPIDTLGGYRLNGEYEIMVPSRKSDVGVRKTEQTFEDESGRISQKSSKITMAQKKGDEMADFTIYKADDEKRLVFGWASVAITVDGEELEDRQHDMIDPEDLEEAAYEYVLNFRDTGEEHLPGYRKKGKLVESCVFTKEKQRAMGIPEGILPVAWWIGFYIEDDDAWQRVKNGTYKMFSIEGKAQREEIEKADRKARSFDDVLKFNPYHGYHGYFSSANAAGAFAPLKGKTENGQRLLNQYKEKHGGKVEEGSGGSAASGGSSKPKHYKKLTNDEALAMAKEMGQEPDQISEEDYDAMTGGHGGSGYFQTCNSFDINRTLRDEGIGGLTIADYETVRALDRNMKPSTRDVQLDRGVGTSFFDYFGIDVDVWDISEGDVERLKEAATGKIYENAGFTSTSFDPNKNVFKGSTVKLNIKAPKGTPMLVSPTRGGWPEADQIEEAEILLARGTAMKITKVKTTHDKWGEVKVEVDCEVLLD